MKKFKTIILIAFAMLLCGCESWSDIQKEYGDILSADPSPVCEYTFDGVEGNTKNYSLTNSINFSANTEGIYAKYDNSSKAELIYGSSGYEANHVLGTGNGSSTTVTYEDTFLKNFLQSYANNKKCPNTIYIQLNPSDKNVFRMDKCISGTECHRYKLISRTQVVNNGTTKDCHFENATSCVKKEVDKYLLEFGYSQNANKYFRVSIKDNYANKKDTLVNTGYVGIAFDGAYFTISENDISNIYKGTNNLNDQITVNSESIDKQYAPGTQIYIEKLYKITPGISQSNTNVKDASDLDNLDNLRSLSIVNSNYKVKEITLCSGNTLKVFQVIGFIVYLAKILIPLLLIILGSVDFAKAVIDISDNGSSQKAAITSFVRRIIVAIIIFLIPTILDILLGLVEGVSETVENNAACKECLFHPTSGCEAPDGLEFEE